MKTSFTPLKIVAFALMLFGFFFLGTGSTNACDFSYLKINNVTTLSNGHVSIDLQMCAGAGRSATETGGDQNTGSFGFIAQGASFTSYPPSLVSPQTNATYTSQMLGTDSLLYTNNSSWWTCIDAGCGTPRAVCKNITLVFTQMPTALVVLGLEGGGLAVSGCMGPEVEVYPNSCGSFSVDAGADVELKGNTNCADLTATVNDPGRNWFSWSDGGNTESIHVCPSATTTYTVSVVNNSNCSAQDDVVVTKKGSGGGGNGGGGGGGGNGGGGGGNGNGNGRNR